ncbi:MAG TPA: hypothetical protein VGC30_07760, partial [Dokdonella sp.]
LLVTSVFFRCAPSPWFVDLAGPAMNALVAAAMLALLASRVRMAPSWRSLCVLVFAFDGCWAAGYAIYSAASLQGDLAFPMRAVAASSAVPLRFAFAGAGLLAYVAVTRTSMRRLPAGVPIVAACAAAIALACVAAACFEAALAVSLREGLQEGVGATLGLLLAARRGAMRPPAADGAALEWSPRWPLAAIVLVAAFVSVLGRGLGDASALDAHAVRSSR